VVTVKSYRLVDDSWRRNDSTIATRPQPDSHLRPVVLARAWYMDLLAARAVNRRRAPGHQYRHLVEVVILPRDHTQTLRRTPIAKEMDAAAARPDSSERDD
jgi:hypothetical protein